MGVVLFSWFDREAQRALALAQKKARVLGQGRVMPLHLAWALVGQKSVRGVLESGGWDPDEVEQACLDALSALPAVGGEVRLGRNLVELLPLAQDRARAMGTEGVDAVRLFALLVERAERLGGSLARVMSRFGVTSALLEALLLENATDGDGEQDAARSLERFGLDLTEEAASGRLDPVVGRDKELRRLVRVLSRRSKNNPVLVGPVGVGRRSIVMGLCARIAAGMVPRALRDVRVVRLDLGALLAGAKYRGDFEERLRLVLEQVAQTGGRTLLFFEDIHRVVGAGSSSGGGMDAAALLTPALARGKVRCIGTTSPEQYRRTLSQDPALERLFQPIDVDEPDDLETLAILRGLRPRFEAHHGIRIHDDALEAAVKLSRRYVQGRYLPDKAVDLLDEAAARLRVELDDVPDELAELDTEIMRVELEADRVRQEDKAGDAVGRLDELQARREKMVEQWHREAELIARAQDIRSAILENERLADELLSEGDLEASARITNGRVVELSKELEEVEAQLEDDSLVPRLLADLVESSDVASVVASWTGIPVDDMLASERERLVSMEEVLGRRVKGQDEAIALISAAVRRARVGLKAPGRPIGSFLFLGPTGVGKTELAKALAKFLFHDEEAIVRLDMSEFMEKASVSRLVGAPPGYVGYESGGQLTEAVRRRPYSLVLFDEVEKAHPEVFDLLLQVLDDGRLTDSDGQTVDMSNTVIVMTSNVGARKILDHAGDQDAIRTLLRDDLFSFFRPEFINRLDEVVIFNPLTKEMLASIADLMIDEVASLLRDRGYGLDLDDSVRAALVDAGWDPAFGARPLRRAVQKHLADPLALFLLREDPEQGARLQVTWIDEPVITVLHPSDGSGDASGGNASGGEEPSGEDESVPG